MKYAGIIKNDLAAAPGISVSFFTQGCPFHCKGCHNQNTWDFNGGKVFTAEVLQEIYDAIAANGIKRSFAVLGGEPLCEENLFLTHMVIQNVKEHFPDIKIYIWTGYTYENLLASKNERVQKILDLTDVLIDGPYIEELRDVTLKMRGSSNQRIIELKEHKNE